MSVQARKLELHVRDKSRVQDTLRKAIDALHFCNLAGGKPAFMLVSCLAYSSTLNMDTKCFSETSVGFRHITRCYMPEDRALQLVLKFEEHYTPKFKIDQSK
jgi:hypothetical protein